MAARPNLAPGNKRSFHGVSWFYSGNPSQLFKAEPCHQLCPVWCQIAAPSLFPVLRSVPVPLHTRWGSFRLNQPTVVQQQCSEESLIVWMWCLRCHTLTRRRWRCAGPMGCDHGFNGTAGWSATVFYLGISSIVSGEMHAVEGCCPSVHRCTGELCWSFLSLSLSLWTWKTVTLA